ncbi:MAG: hypothetical protein ACI9NY_001663 [Kiritimatiellia bacterium]|jgi:hypothetical protein
MKIKQLHRICLLSLLILIGALGGCGQTFDVKQLGKGDIDFVADSHRKEAQRLLFELMEKLYKRNPNQLNKQLDTTIEAQVGRLKTAINQDSPLLIDGLEGVDLLKQAFDQEFTGDRVFTLVGGLLSMIHKSYGYHLEFYMFDTLDQQKLYNSARNIEVFSWRLRTAKDDSQQLLILSTQLMGETTNLSFERLVSKLIAMQDMMALIAADGDRRTINGVAQGFAQMVFLPI